ncbi:MAG: hypothetical protein OEV94_02245 [Deltaproteobacteria bacterium]|nr:hypothetical protein [Deltaproteobacteria bacterium]
MFIFLFAVGVSDQYLGTHFLGPFAKYIEWFNDYFFIAMFLYYAILFASQKMRGKDEEAC